MNELVQDQQNKYSIGLAARGCFCEWQIAQGIEKFPDLPAVAVVSLSREHIKLAFI